MIILTIRYPLDNRGKRAIAVNTGTEEGREIVRKLVEDADVFLTNVRPGQLKQQGLDFDTLSKINPKLVYASVTGFGLKGEEADKPGFDTAAFNAKSGFGWIMTPKGAAPAPLRTAAGDHITGIATASGILAALLKARETGKGTLVESSLVRSAAYAVGCDYGTWLRYGRIARSRPREEAIVAINNYYMTKDECWLFINGRPNEPDWPDVARAIGREDLIEDERFGSLRDRRRNGVELIAAMDEAFAQKTLDEWKPIHDGRLIWSPVQTFEQAFEDPQMHAPVFMSICRRPMARVIKILPHPFALAMKALTRRGHFRKSGNIRWMCWSNSALMRRPAKNISKPALSASTKTKLFGLAGPAGRDIYTAA